MADELEKLRQDFFVIPEGTGIRFTRNIGDKPADQLETEAKGVGTVSRYASDMLHNPKFTTLEEVTLQELIKLRVQDFGLPGRPTTTELFERIQHSRIGDMALELCRAEVGPHQRIEDTEQPLDDWYYVVHEPITDRSGDLRVFEVARDARGLWLDARWAGPDYEWPPEFQLVVALRKIEPVKA